MVTNPSDYVESLGKAGASGFTFHIEVARGKRTSVGKWLLVSIFPLLINKLVQTTGKNLSKTLNRRVCVLVYH
jgi:hypothetical protein